MDDLLANAIASIKLGVEDYEVDRPARALSAIRNLHAGLLLLAKWVLLQTVPNASEEDVIAADYKPVPDGRGGVMYVPENKQTIGLRDIQQRFKSFHLKVPPETLRNLESLAHVRNAVEHRYAGLAEASLRKTVSDSFVVASEFLKLGGINPVDVLGEAWRTMLKVNEVYERELATCRKTFADVEWKFDLPEDAYPKCPTCGSGLIEQVRADEKMQDCVDGRCKSCGEEIEAEAVVESLVETGYWAWDHISVKDGGEGVVFECHSCTRRSYINELADNGEVTGCVICGAKLGSCWTCGSSLTPDDLYGGSEDLCGYCGYKLAKEMERG